MATVEELLANADEAMALGDLDLAQEFIDLAAGAEQPQQQQPEADTLTGTVRAFGRGASFGLTAELAAGARAATEMLQDTSVRSLYDSAREDVVRYEQLVANGKTAFSNKLEEARERESLYFDALGSEGDLSDEERGDFTSAWSRFWNLQQQYREDEVKQHEAFVQQHPFIGVGMEIAGAIASAPVSMATAGAAGARLALNLGAKEGSKRLAAAAGASAGVAELGIYGAATAQDTSLQGRLKEGAKMAAIGATVGGAAGAAGAKIGEVLTSRRISTQVSRIEDDLSEIVATNPNVTPEQALAEAAARSGLGVEELSAIERISPIRVPTQKEALATLEYKNAIAQGTQSLGKPGGAFKDFIQTIQSRVQSISPSVGRMLRRFEQNVLDDRMAYDKRLVDLSGYYKMPAVVRENIDFALANGDRAYLRRLLENQGDAGRKLLSAFDEGFEVQKELYKRGQAVGWFDPETPGQIANYWGRTVKDLKGLKAALGRPEQALLEKSETAYAKSLGKDVSQLTAKERELVISNAIKGRAFRAKGENGKPGFTKERTVEFVSKDLNKFYNDPVQSIMLNINRNVEGIAKMKAFNRSASGATMEGRLKYVQRTTDNDSVMYEDGFVREIDRQFKAGNINAQQRDELVDLIGARIHMHDKELPAMLRDVKNVGVTLALGQLKNTVMQLADIGQAFGIHGVRNTTKAILGGRKFKVDDLSLDKTLTTDLETMSRSGRFLRNVLRSTGFARTDLIGKSVHINARYNKLAKQLQTEGGQAAFDRKWGQYYGRDIDQLKRELATGEITPLTREHMFAELADIQPIVPSEMPKAYLTNPYVRMGYTLKSWAVKQLNVINDRVIKAARRGDYATASKNAIMYSLFTVGGSALTDKGRRALFTGEPITADGVSEALGWHALGVLTIVGNQYSAEKLLRGDVQGFLAGAFFPPLSIFEASFADAKRIVQSTYDPDAEPLTTDNSRMVRLMPIVGDITANHPYLFWLGGRPVAKEER